MRVLEGRVVLQPGDLARFSLITERFPLPAPWTPGRWLTESRDRLWLELVTQLAVVGGRRSAERMWESGDIGLLRLDVLIPLARTDMLSAQWHVHGILAANGVRYASANAPAPSVKARQIVQAACSPKLVQEGVFRLREMLHPLLPGPPEWSNASRERERAARAKLVSVVSGFGMKSASDYLNHLGASQNLIAFDSRIQSLLRDGFGLDEGIQRRYVSQPSRYEELERPFVEEVCPHLGMPPAVLDEMLFANSHAARRVLAVGT
ncbi:MAG: hypothetical protein M3Q29_14250 [Chloroflexota bacterium]|nr:hypothetical protein [Chloroflexota bacterium]